MSKTIINKNLSTVHGIGKQKVTELKKQGINSVSDLRRSKSVKLSNSQQLGLKWHSDITKKIPYHEVQYHITLWKNVIPSKMMGVGSMVTGSFRRKLKWLNDIDLIITQPLAPVVNILQKSGYVIGTLSNGSSKWSGIVRLPSSGIGANVGVGNIIPTKRMPIKPVARRLDILYARPEEYWFAVVYFTGSKVFNIKMRKRAKSMGYSLDEKGLWDSKRNRVITPRNEKDIFKALKLVYVPPHGRLH
jgi:DNA polymerase beta